jgi:Icc-related predicted phosphoesterase
MKCVAISDTHTLHKKVTLPEGDVLIHAGDFSSRGSIGELQRFANWMKKQPFEHKLVIPGNHDWASQRSPGLAYLTFKERGITYLLDSGCEIDGVKFWGSPWQPEFCDWAFNLPRDGNQLEAKWAMIPGDTDVLITHGPPHGILDVAPPFMGWGCGPPPEDNKERRVGCKLLLAHVKVVKPKVHVFGHIHLSHGAINVGPTRFINAAICTEDYKATNQPITFSVEKKEEKNEDTE